MESKKETISYLNNISLFLLGILFLVFPVLVLNQTTEPFILPKQALLIGLSLIILILQGVRTLVEGTIKLRRTPFDLPLSLIVIVFIISSALSINRVDAVISFVPFLFAMIAYFFITNLVKDKSSLVFIKSCLIAGGAVLAIITSLSFFKIYVFPFDFAKTSSFTPLGSAFDSAIYLVLVLAVAFNDGIKVFKDRKIKGENTGFIIGGLVSLVGFGISIYQLVLQNPIILPFETGFQTAFAAISQDTGRIVQGFLFGSGPGTFAADFTRFKPMQFNLSTAWMYSFYRSSSFILETLTTVGVLGFVSFCFLFYKIIKERPLYIPLALGIVALFILPFSFLNVALFFIILGVFAASQGLKHSNKYFDIELEIVALRKGLITFENALPEKRKDRGIILAVISFVVILVFAGFVSFYTYFYLLANYHFQKSLAAASQNNGTMTYQSQVAGLSAFNLSDSYHRVFSQTNLALATNLANAVQKSGKEADTQTSQTITTLIQQSINSARSATSIAPQTALNWQNLSSIYRSLIGFGQNADQFAILSAQQAILLDPNNPQEYINLGGIYYQLGIWDSAIQQFQVAINLKPDLANAYYNLGHAYEQKGDFKNALAQYQVVKNLTSNDKASANKINEEIKALQAKANVQTEGTEQQQTQASNEKQNIEVNKPSVVLPTQTPQVKIPGPSITPTPTQPEQQPSPTVTPTEQQP